jgi:hypothetical protein
MLIQIFYFLNIKGKKWERNEKEIIQSHFRTKTHPLFTALHSLWYKWDNDKTSL